MSLARGAQHRENICTVLDAFGEHASSFIFLGGCAIALYARATGAPLRVTKDVDCLSNRKPWAVQEAILAKLCEARVINPDRDLQCRYRIVGSDVDVDVLSPDGMNIGGGNPWLARAAQNARSYQVAPGRTVLAVSPPYFLATKLVAFEDRGEDVQSSKDAEDVVTLTIEVPDLVEQVEQEGLRLEIRDLWVRAMAKHHMTLGDLEDLVDFHIHGDDRDSRPRAVEAVRWLASK